MKTLLMTLALFSAVAQADISLSKIQQSKDQVTLSVESEERSSMCGLGLTRLTLTAPIVTEELFHEEKARIEVDFATDPRAMCMMAFGPHRGAVTLKVAGQNQRPQLPLLTKGQEYVVVVNGVTQPQVLKVE